MKLMLSCLAPSHCSASNYLGQKAACTIEHIKLLNYLVDIFVPILTTHSLPDYSKQVKTALKQAVVCLYSQPSNKSPMNMDTEKLLRIVSLVLDCVHVEKRRQVAMDYVTGKTNRTRKLLI